MGWLVCSKRRRTGVSSGANMPDPHFDFQEKYWLLSARKIILYLRQMKPVGPGSKRAKPRFPKLSFGPLSNSAAEHWLAR